MVLFNSYFNFRIPLLVGFVILFDGCKAPGPPKWVKVDYYAKAKPEYPDANPSTKENPSATYNPNLPEELRAKYKGKEWNSQVMTDVCSHTPDSGYFCVGAIGDLPPLHQRFYFDVRTQSCRCFLYNGCDGNQNNFRSYEHCIQWCSRNLTLFDRRRTLGKSVYSFAKNSAKCYYFY